MVDPQNINARYIDRFGSNKITSTRIHAPPGGKSTFSLGWGAEEEPKKKVVEKVEKVDNSLYTNNYNYQKPTSDSKNFKSISNKQVLSTNPPQEKTSVKVKYAPGGQSSIIFG